MVHYLVALDCSEGSMKALQKTIKIMNKESDHITALHAVDFPVTAALVDPLGGQIVSSATAEVDSTLQSSKDCKEMCCNMCHRDNVKFEYLEKYGVADEVINAAVENMHPDVLVLGTRGLGFVERYLLGSVSSKFLTHPPCTLLLVP
eukprot:Phypoly_transcript_23078.p1 GENE.Phypoly_transcript_23078~~Phypoly_transcript_23078.p1  ORF type:complete len:147 (+),score=21.80 Phypoly_transcript_23078:97-537(+)